MFKENHLPLGLVTILLFYYKLDNSSTTFL